jgi:branched-chain amino acid transport system permease protein
MGFNLQLLFTGIGIGSIYALVALGFALIYRATNVVNFAQGDFAMLGAFAMVVLAIDLELPYWLSILITLALLVGFGALFNLAVYYPLRNRGFLPVIISTIGASILLENGVLAAYGPRPQSLDSMFAVPGFSIGDVFFDSQYIVILVVSMVMVALQYVFFERTLIGKKMQATSQDKEMASLLGIPVMLMIMLTFMYSAMLGGLAGILVAPVLFVTVGMGSSIALKAFAACIIGGFGDVAGAIVGAGSRSA